MNDKQLEALAVVIAELIEIGTENLSREDRVRMENGIEILRSLPLFEVENE